MKVSKFITTLNEPLDVDIQLIATELDTSAKRIKFICRTMLTDVVTIEGYDSMLKDIEENCPEVLSFDDNTVMYEFLDEPIVIYTTLSDKVFLFDVSNAQKFETKMFSYRN